METWIKNKKKESQLEKYIKNNAPEKIINFIKLGGGNKLGCVAERYCRFKFDILKERQNTDHDHIIKYNNKIIKIEQKTATLSNNNFLWQHICLKHSWDILLFMKIDYNEIIFYGINRTIFNKLYNDGKITNQGSNNKKSKQGLWCKYTNIKNDIIIINTNQDLIDLLI